MKNADLLNSLQKELVAHVTAICGRRGEEWLENLPDIISRLEDQWSVSILKPFPAIEFNFVAPALRNGSEAVVVKISPPYEHQESRSEATYLRTHDGEGVVRLLAEDRHLDAILLERAIPGKNLTELFAENESACLFPAVEILKRIAGPVTADLGDVIMLDHWFDGLRRASSTRFPPDYVEKALELYDNLLRDQPNLYLHGDFHPANIVSAQRSPYLAIDPKGIVGPLGYDIAVFLNNYHWWQEMCVDIRDRLEVAVRTFSEAFGINVITLRRWAFAQMVLSAWWTFDEMPELYEKDVEKSDIWDV